MTCSSCGGGVLYATDPMTTCANGVAVPIQGADVTCDGVTVMGTCISQQNLIIGGAAAAVGIGALIYFMTRKKSGSSGYSGMYAGGY